MNFRDRPQEGNYVEGNDHSEKEDNGIGNKHQRIIEAQDLVLKLSALENERDEKRKEMGNLFQEMQAIRKRMTGVESELHGLDDEISGIEQKLELYKDLDDQTQSQAKTQAKPQDPPTLPSANSEDDFHNKDSSVIIETPTKHDATSKHDRYSNVRIETQLTDPLTSLERDEMNAENHPPTRMNTSSSVIGQLNIVEHQKSSSDRSASATKHKATTIDSFFNTNVSNKNEINQVSQKPKENITTNHTIPSERSDDTNNLSFYSNDQNHIGKSSTHPHGGNTLAPPNSFFGVASTQNIQQHSRNNMQSFASNEYPWSKQLMQLLQNMFRIESFRDHQKEIINCTLSGKDVFVIMRTGGGKSLTYQLPAVIEGRYSGHAYKITLVISPLLSLIHDQVEQMNQFVANSALSFTSGIGNAEHNKRWAQVRDPNSGICMIFVTPEKVSKSGKLRSELEKLFEQNRLGRFVIDECHCASQWGHDFRPDYTKLGLLKTHFPSIPLIAVTATASDKVREDCCRILRLGTNYQFFRSTANRPNLTYSIMEKGDGKGKVVSQIADYIKEKHSENAGIIYTFSRNEADDVADKLCDYGIVARSYHSSISGTQKEQTHRSWMKNQTQVVVATIAFGLGINKPDVRFVLHHSLSKSLESYYQESGRAGRDGKPADCVLYYSAKDVPRMLCMIHGESNEGSFWSMVRYAQTAGKDLICRDMILRVLGEVRTERNESDLEDHKNETTEARDVTVHAKTVIQLVFNSVESGRKTDKVTLNQLITAWRSTSKNVPNCVRINRPGSDLNKDECERLIVSLLLEDILHPKIMFTAYNSTMYIVPGPKAEPFLLSTRACVNVRFPKRKGKASISKQKAAKTSTTKKVKAGGKTKEDDGGWISTNKKGTSATKKGKKSKGVKGSTNTKSTSSSIKRDRSKKTVANSRVIELLVSSSDEEEIINMTKKKKPRLERLRSKQEDDEDSSDFGF